MNRDSKNVSDLYVIILLVKVKVLFFAGLREIVGKKQMNIELQDGAPVSRLLEKLQKDFPGIITNPVMLAVNTEYVKPDHRLKDGDEVAVIPPVSGG